MLPVVVRVVDWLRVAVDAVEAVDWLAVEVVAVEVVEVVS